MFRATPAYYNKVDCIESKGDINCTISKFDSLLKDGEYVKVSDCNINDVVTLYENKQPVLARIKDLKFINESNTVEVVLEVIDTP